MTLGRTMPQHDCIPLLLVFLKVRNLAVGVGGGGGIDYGLISHNESFYIEHSNIKDSSKPTVVCSNSFL
ncbi:MAG TPA: hypothetical protein DEF18_16780 [Muricauda sp.]|nr:hypothetical protein [Allomuricauda sp.]